VRDTFRRKRARGRANVATPREERDTTAVDRGVNWALRHSFSASVYAFSTNVPSIQPKHLTRGQELDTLVIDFDTARAARLSFGPIFHSRRMNFGTNGSERDSPRIDRDTAGVKAPTKRANVEVFCRSLPMF